MTDRTNRSSTSRSRASGERPLLVELALQCQADSDRWFPSIGNDIGYHALSMAGEVGEFCNIVKKIQRGSLDSRAAAVRHDLSMELTDAFVYMLNIAALMNINLEQSYYIKRAENEKRFGPNASK